MENISYTILSKRTIVQRYLGNSTSVSVGERLWRAVAPSHSYALSQDLFQLGRGASSDQGSDQCQGIVIEVSL